MPAWSAAFDHDDWNTLLSKHVSWQRDGVASSVNYEGFAADRDALSGYLSRLSALRMDRFQALNRSDRLAFLINAYNAFTHAAFDIAREDGDAKFKDMDGAGFKDRYLFDR